MKLAAIDIGTNSMRLFICDYINGQIINRKKVVNVSGYVWIDENYGKESTRNSLYKQDSNDNKDY